MNLSTKSKSLLLTIAYALLKHGFIALSFLWMYKLFAFYSNWAFIYYTAPEKTFWITFLFLLTYISGAFAFNSYDKKSCIAFLARETRDVYSDLFSFSVAVDLAVSAIYFVLVSFKFFSVIGITLALLSNVGTLIFSRMLWMKKAGSDNPTFLFLPKLLVHLALSLPGMFILIVLGTGFTTSIPTLLMVLKLLSYMLIFPAIFIVFIYLRAIGQMSKFLRKLKKFCKNNHIKAPKIKAPYLSVFITRPSNTFEIEIHGIIYACNVISFANIFLPVIFKTDGYFHRISARKMKHKIKPTLNLETYYGFDSTRKKIVIMPSSPYVIKIQEGTLSKTFDSGDVCGEYKIFTPEGFFGAAERNTLSRKRYD